MARVVALLPDLLFGSKVQGMLAAAGHDVTVVGSPAAALEQLEVSDLLVADLCEDAQARIDTLAPAAAGDGVKALAFYLHTDVATRTRAIDAGFDLVVPRSRMAREGAALVDGLLAPA
jgi:hypothetical protein